MHILWMMLWKQGALNWDLFVVCSPYQNFWLRASDELIDWCHISQQTTINLLYCSANQGELQLVLSGYKLWIRSSIDIHCISVVRLCLTYRPFYKNVSPATRFLFLSLTCFMVENILSHIWLCASKRRAHFQCENFQFGKPYSCWIISRTAFLKLFYAIAPFLLWTCRFRPQAW